MSAAAASRSSATPVFMDDIPDCAGLVAGMARGPPTSTSAILAREPLSLAAAAALVAAAPPMPAVFTLTAAGGAGAGAGAGGLPPMSPFRAKMLAHKAAMAAEAAETKAAAQAAEAAEAARPLSELTAEAARLRASADFLRKIAEEKAQAQFNAMCRYKQYLTAYLLTLKHDTAIEAAAAWNAYGDAEALALKAEAFVCAAMNAAAGIVGTAKPQKTARIQWADVNGRPLQVTTTIPNRDMQIEMDAPTTPAPAPAPVATAAGGAGAGAAPAPSTAPGASAEADLAEIEDGMWDDELEAVIEEALKAYKQ